MTSKLTREELLNIIETDHVQCGEASALARMALAAMDSEPVEMPLDYLQGHKDGLEWAAQLAEANHPETGDWLYDDPIELAKAIRKGPDMPPVQPVADSEPVIVVGDDGGDALSYRRLIQSFEPGTKLYRHAQSVPVVSADLLHTAASAIEDLLTTKDRTGACVWFDLPFRLRSAANAHSAPVVPDDVLAALQKVARIRLDLNDFDGYRRGIADCLGDAEEALIEVVNRRAAMLQAGTLANEDTKQAGNSPVIPGAEKRIADAVELLKQAAPAMLADNGGPDGPLVGRLKSPVIPDGWTCNDKANAALMMLDRIETADPVDDDRIDGIKRIVSELVAATQPQNAPQNIPEIISGWIPVSDRMPIEFEAVIAFDGDQVYGEAMYSSDDGFTIDGYEPCDRLNLQNVTHWMPLPAAPAGGEE